jgi:hypothetical protein
VIKLKENNEIENKNLLREGSFTFMTNTLVFLSPLLRASLKIEESEKEVTKQVDNT